MAVPSCFAGKILNVDLTAGRIQEEQIPEKMYRDFIGGNGLGIRLLYERIKPKTDPLGPDNILGFVAGALTANAVPGSGRYIVVTKSPLTGTWTEANSGGTLGPEMKTAGYDGILFSGISPRPVYLLIKDGKAELKDASAIWGKDTYDTEDILHQDLGDSKIKIACIGPSGESCSLLAGVMNEKGRTAARGGVGAVMGSKRLKAIAIKGGIQKITPTAPEKLKESRQKFLSTIKSSEFAKGLSAAGTGSAVGFLVSIGDSPLKNWQLTGTEAMPTANKLDSGNMDKYKTEGYGCHSCPIRCGAIIEQKEGPFAIKDELHRPEYETLSVFGGLLLNDNLESVIKANDICNRYGIDTITTGAAVALAMECYDRGLIDKKDTGGIDLAWGNASGIVEIIEKTAKMEGFGKVLVDGVTKAAERIGKGADKYAVSVRGKGLALHDPRMSPSLGTMMIADANPSHHMDCQVTGTLDNGGTAGNDQALPPSKYKLFEDYDKKGPTYAAGTEYHALLNASGMCSLYTINSVPPPLADLIAGATGWDFSWEEGLKAGRRILTLRQAFNAREGLTPDQIDLPRRIKEEPIKAGPAVGVKIDFTALKKSYYETMGWDFKTGKPSQTVLSELGLADITRDLEA